MSADQRNHPAQITVGLVGAGHMGSGLGWALREGGHDVITALAGRSDRTAAMVRSAGIGERQDLRDVVTEASVLLVVTPPDAAIEAAKAIAIACADTGAHPVVADLNAISPTTVRSVAAILSGTVSARSELASPAAANHADTVSARSELASPAAANHTGPEFVDGSISGPPPTVRPGARIYLSGPLAGRIAGLNWTHAEPVVVSDQIGDASAIKMCTASVYKGVTAILTEAVRAADYYGVLDDVLADLARDGYSPAARIALAAGKAWRYVPEMREIAATQAAAGLPGELFEAMALVYAQVAGTALARELPESVDAAITAAAVVAGLRA